MPYCTYAQITAELGQNATAILGTLNEAAITAIIVQVDGYIDDYVKQALHVDVPITEDIPEVIKRISRKLTLFEVYQRQAHADTPDHIQKQLDWAEKTLKDIRDGKLTVLPDEDEEADDRLRYDCTTAVFSTDMP